MTRSELIRDALGSAAAIVAFCALALAFAVATP